MLLNNRNKIRVLQLCNNIYSLNITERISSVFVFPLPFCVLFVFKTIQRYAIEISKFYKAVPNSALKLTRLLPNSVVSYTLP